MKADTKFNEDRGGGSATLGVKINPLSGGGPDLHWVELTITREGVSANYRLDGDTTAALIALLKSVPKQL